MSSGGGQGAAQGASQGAAFGPYAAAYGAGVGLITSMHQARLQKLQGDMVASRMEHNAKLASIQAEEILEQGNDQASQMEQEVRQMIGAQKVSLAAQGVEIDSGTAAQLQQEAREVGDEDVATIKNNAWKEAWGIRTQASDMRSQANMSKITSAAKASDTLITGGLNAVNQGYSSYRRWK